MNESLWNTSNAHDGLVDRVVEWFTQLFQQSFYFTFEAEIAMRYQGQIQEFSMGEEGTNTF